MALLLVGLRIGCNAWLNVLQKRALPQLSSSLLVTATFVLLAVLVTPFLFFYSFINLPAAFWGNMFLVVALDLPGNFFLVKSIGLADLSLIGPLNAYKPVVALLLGFFVLGEFPSMQGWAGVAIIFMGSLWLAPKREVFHSPQTKSFWRNRGAQLRLLALVLTAAASIFLKAAINASSAMHTLIAWAVLGALAAIVLLLIGRREQARTSVRQTREKFGALLLMAGLFLGMQLVTLQAFALLNVAYVLALFQLSGLVNVVLGWKLFNEGDILRRAWASVIMIAGAALLLFK